MTRPEKPPQIIAAGDMYSDMVDILLDGKKDSYGLWTSVDAVAGVGTKFTTDTAGRLIRDDAGECAIETVHGNFEVVWLSE